MKQEQLAQEEIAHHQNLKKYQLLSGSAIKVIALITMFIDHFGAIVLSFIYVNIFNYYGLWEDKLAPHYFQSYEMVKTIYMICRMIGRMSFPLFCFLLVEGFIYTRNRKRYAMRLFIFALISELPFDFAVYSYIDNPEWPFSRGHCNIFFTLLIGLIAMGVIDYLDRHPFNWKGTFQRILIFIMQYIGIFSLAGLAEKMGTDYGAYGVLLIVVMYYFRKNRLRQVIVTFFYMALYASIGHSFQPMYLVSLFCMLLYNGQKGKIRLKYFFYAFYPVHIILLTLCVFMLSAIYKVPYQESYLTDKSICFYLNEKVYCTLNQGIEQTIVQGYNWLDTHLVIRYAKGTSSINAKVISAKGEMLAQTTLRPGEESEPLFIPHQSGKYSVVVSSDTGEESIFRVYEVYKMR